ncbi:MAG TPA: DUF4105 domain-containing protein [Polyangiales bacterium]|nr:DUF4105 domain-containing protein [Polyangiales bacterium]
MLRIAVLCATWLWASALLAQSPSRWADSDDRDLRVSLVTFGPGDAVHQYFGHNALWVQDDRREEGVLYNFGMFGFGPDMLTQYLQGQLMFWSAPTPVQSTFAHYAADNRSVHVQELDLSAERRRRFAERLEWYVQPDNRYYRYHHYFNNCSTKLRDLIDEALGGQFKHAYSGRGLFTYRGDTRRYTEHDPVINMLLMLWMNDFMEQPIRRYDEAFLPPELERQVAVMKYRDESGQQVPLVKLQYAVFDARRAPVPGTPSTVWPRYLAFGLLLGGSALALALWLRRTRSVIARVLFGLHQMLLGLLLGVPGLVATLLLLTKWDVCYYNENLFLANALGMLSFPFGLWAAFGSHKGLRWLGAVWLALGASTLALLVLKVLPNFDQDVSIPLALFVPVNLGCALAHYALRKARVAAAAEVPPARGLEGAR